MAFTSINLKLSSTESTTLKALVNKYFKKMFQTFKNTIFVTFKLIIYSSLFNYLYEFKKVTLTWWQCVSGELVYKITREIAFSLAIRLRYVPTNRRTEVYRTK